MLLDAGCSRSLKAMAAVSGDRRVLRSPLCHFGQAIGTKLAALV